MSGEELGHPVFTTLPLRIAAALTALIALGVVGSLALRAIESIGPTPYGTDPRQQQMAK